MKRKKIRITLVCLMAAFVLTLTGCLRGKSDADGRVDDSTVVFTFGDTAVTRGEVYIYINTIKERYELQYGSDVWKVKLGTEGDATADMEQLTREAVVYEIVKVKTLVAHAEDYGVKLPEEVEGTIDGKTKIFYEGLTDEDKTSMDISEETVHRVFYENALAEAVMEAILADDPVEVSDEEARMTRFYDLFFPCYTVDTNGIVTPYSEADTRRQYEDAVNACGRLATAGLGEEEVSGIRELAKEYGLKDSKEQTLSPEEIRETYGDEICKALYSMENGDYSTVLESEYGYHVFQMIELTARDATDEKKASVREAMMSEKLKDKIAVWEKEIDKKFSYPDSVDMEVYDTVEIEKVTEEEK